MVADTEVDLEADVLVLPTEFMCMCAKPDEYPQPTGFSSLDFVGEMFIADNSKKLSIVESSQRDFSVMRNYDRSLRTGLWRIEQALPIEHDPHNSWTTAIENVTYTFDGQSCTIRAAKDIETLSVTFLPGARRDVRIARFVLK